MSTSQSTSEDQAILQQVPIVCSLLGLKRMSPHKLFWQETIYGGRSKTNVPVNYLHVDGRRLTLAKRMQGFLTPDEWRPLIGSILLLRSWAKPRLLGALAASIVAVVIYYGLVIYLAIQGILGNASSGNIVLLLFPLFTPVIIIWLIFQILNRRSGPDARRDVLKADIQVAGVIGSEQFLAVLEKIDGMGIKDNQRLIPRGFRSKQPSIQERIQNLRFSGTNSSTPSKSCAHQETIPK